jgi:hypothetical protein
MAEFPSVRIEQDFVGIEAIAKFVIVGEKPDVTVATCPSGIENPVRSPTAKAIDGSVGNTFQTGAPDVIVGIFL